MATPKTRIPGHPEPPTDPTTQDLGPGMHAGGGDGRLRVAVIAALRHGLREPMAGGLERHTADLARSLRRAGHEVTVFASGDADPDLGVEPICPTESQLDLSPAARRDVSMLSERFMVEHDAYLRLMLSLADRPFDVIHDNGLHYLPIAMAKAVRVPVVKVLHTPPTPWLESALRHRADNVTVVSVSASNAAGWSLPVDEVVPNGVDLGAFPPGPGGGPASWVGRIVPEKGPHLAVQAARLADVPMDLAGPVGDEVYWRAEVEPLLDDRRRYVGHLGRSGVAELVGRAAVAVITPMWEEPYGLVVAEALACGTPVAGFAVGALPDLVTPEVGVLVDKGDAVALASAIHRAAALDRAACRTHAEAIADLDAMAARYVEVYRHSIRRMRRRAGSVGTPTPVGATA